MIRELLVLIAVLIVAALYAGPPIHKVTVEIQLPKIQQQAAFSEKEVQCLADAIYGEARGEPLVGQLAVGAVVINRSLSPKYPHDLCKVVHQKNQFVPLKCRTLSAANATINGYLTGRSTLARCTFFHSGKMTKTMYGAKYVTTIGRHHFFA